MKKFDRLGSQYLKVPSILMASIVTSLTACSLSPHDPGQSHLYFSIDATGHSNSQASISHLGQNSPVSMLMPVGFSSPQPIPSGYADCYAVNVVGSGISDSNGKGEDVYRLPAMLNGASCGYAGILSKPVLRGTSAEIDLQIPSGPKRLIQMVGIFDNGTGICARGLDDQGSDNAGIFELGRATVDLFSDQSVEIQNGFPNPLAPNYASALGARRINCHDGSGGDGGGGAPARFAWLPLPNPFDATQSHSILNRGCSAVQLQLQNSSGNQTSTPSPFVLNFSSTDSGILYSDASCTIGTTSFPGGMSTQTFYFKNIVAGPDTLQVSAAGFPVASDTLIARNKIEVTPGAVAGYCHTFQVRAADASGTTDISESRPVILHPISNVPSATFSLWSGSNCSTTASPAVNLSSGSGQLSILGSQGGQVITFDVLENTPGAFFPSVTQSVTF